MKHLVDQNMAQLYKQRNSIDDAEDARRKYILRRQVEALVPYFTLQYDTGPFKLFCDDLRPGNVLVDEQTLRITAVLDWEWTYAAPRQFLYSPPWWLILAGPLKWFNKTETLYKEKLALFLKTLEDVEEKREREMHTPVPKVERVPIRPTSKEQNDGEEDQA